MQDARERPAEDLPNVVEAYLQRYQPGPLPRLFQSTFLYDRNGSVLAELYSEGRRTWVGLDRVSSHLINATIATEDATFFINTGVDPFRVAGAALQNFEEGQIVSGASTITMQVARNLFMSEADRFDQSFDRKILEVGLARELTEAYTKGEVLEMYLNLLNYGGLTYGPEAAAQNYFGKSAQDLNLAEAAMLAGIPQSPALLNPLRNFDRAKARQQIVLGLMVRHGYLSQEEADAAFAEPLNFNPNPGVQPMQAPHFVNYVVGLLDQRLGRGFTRRAGLHIYTTLDLPLQQMAQETVSQKVRELAPRFGMNNAALVAMRPGTAEILAMVGSVDYANPAIDGQVNVATSPRQPGSAIKPLLYAIALEDNLISPATVIWDTPITYTVGLRQTYDPRNYDRRYHGPVTARAALANSYNVPAVKLLNSLGIERMVEGSRALGVTSLTQPANSYGLSIALGGSEVTLLDLASAYTTMASQGIHNPARSILAVQSATGVGLLDDRDLSRPQRVLSEATAFLITDIMADNNARVPMFGRNSWLALDRPVAAKTGTTDNNRDAWAVGYTRYLTVGVWTGNTRGQAMRGATGVGAAGPIWNAFMNAVNRNPVWTERINAPNALSLWDFATPDSVALQEVCPPNMTCRPGGEEYFSLTWLADAQQSGGPLSDTVVQAPSASVFVQGQLRGYCLAEEGPIRTLVRLPARHGLPSSVAAQVDSALDERQAAAAGAIALINQPSANLALLDINERDLDGESLLERRKALPYIGAVGNMVSLGPCDQVNLLFPNAVINYEQAPVVIATPTPGSGDEAEQEATPTPEEGTPASVSTPIPPQFAYRLAEAIRHDTSCPGSYVMGRILNRQGGPVPGIRVQMVDGWGNVYFAETKSGALDFGIFDFPLYSATPQDLQVTVLDGGGSPISPTITVPHNQGGASNLSCHYVVFQQR
jgi:penicillin-binding protein 1C